MSVLVFVFFFFDLMHIELSFAILSKKKKRYLEPDSNEASLRHTLQCKLLAHS